MDLLLDFDPTAELYFQKEDSVEVQQLIQQAGSSYADGDAELPLLKAFFHAPDSLNVLVALNRFYYYQHRLSEALLTSEKALKIIASNIDFPTDWQQIDGDAITSAPKDQLTWIRLYLFTLKSIGFLKMRLHDLDTSKQIFEKLNGLDQENRIGASGLLDIVNRKINENNNIYNLG
ncbi:hypothetical protein [Methylophaga sp.]|uniref:hypothetical protein n=1 Tax=Methylophaga sp. TaxID=2024840 RepID=UPI002722E15C|nr:hypothetical protein [Methylophaga sp.]MDO8828069.1 hypothetical protein [Methylophaga sp.]